MAVVLPVGEPAPSDGSLLSHVSISPDIPFGVYVHVPFCRVRCGYCDFNTYTAAELPHARPADFADTVVRELDLAAEVLGAHAPLRPASTVFFGGGTPTLLPPGHLGRVHDAVRTRLGVAPGAEVTVEANPDTVTDERASELAEAGVTRLSVGMQSADPRVLITLDRTHNPENVATAVAAARAAGLAVSLDIIYGAPGETLAQWHSTVQAALELQPDHISAYALIIEDGTKLARHIRRGEVPKPDDDLQADMYELVSDLLGGAGYEWYEVSNWAQDASQRSRHNLGYWQGHDWWGFGPGAHSHIAGVRFWNVKHPTAYAERLGAGRSPAAGREQLSAQDRLTERVMLETRIRDGLPISILPPVARTAVAGLIADDLVQAQAAFAGRIVLTRRGRLLADVVVRALTA